MNLTTFEKNGKQINVEVEGTKVFLNVEGKAFEVKEMKSHAKHGYYYVVDNAFAGAIGKSAKGNVNVVEASAKQAMAVVAQNKRNAKVEEAKNLDDNHVIEVRIGVDSTVTGFETNDFFKNSLYTIRKNGVDIEKELNREADRVTRGEYETIETFKMTMKEFKELLKAAEEKQEKRESKVNEKFEEAKKTNTKVEISRTSEVCSDDNEDCDVDIIVTYAMPDGSKKTERYHTW